MEVKKVGCFSANEIEKLRDAGTILGAIAKAFEDGQIDALDARDIELVNALVDVLSRIGFYTNKKQQMAELDKNLEEVTELALTTGEKIVTVDCPCCGKTFYALESEAAYTVINRDEQTDFAADLKRLSGKTLGRKCPFCGFSGSFAASDFLNLGKDFAKTDIETSEKAEEIRDRNASTWAEINNIGLKFEG